MELTGQYQISASQDRVWHALNDAEVLRASIPGIESLEKKSDTEFVASLTAKIGPVKVKFAGTVTLTELNPPHSYKITGEGKGGAAGFAKGVCQVNLDSETEKTVLRYNADAQVGGKLAQIGSRMISGAAKKLADEFFSSFVKQLEQDGESELSQLDEKKQADEPKQTVLPGRATIRPVFWIVSLLLIVSALLWAFS